MSNKHFQKDNKSSSFSPKGFYIALGVCLIAIGVAAWTTYDSVVNYTNPQEEIVSSQAAHPANEAVSGILEVPKTSSTAPVSSEEPKKTESAVPSSQPPKQPVSSAEPAKPTAVTPQSFSYPVGETVLREFSGENLIYSETMQDWRVHAGVDFAAKEGDPVKAIADGTVKDAYHDDLFGNVVYIEHGNVGSCYCGLQDMNVKAGDPVKAGQEIGTVGVTPCESADEAHLHFAVKNSGKWVDPLTILK